MRHTSISKILITYVVAGVLLLTLSPTAYLRASTTIKGESIIVDTPVLSLTTASADTTLTATTAAHEAMISIVFGTVSGTYTTCTAQLKTSLDNTNFLTLGSPQSITVTTGTVNVWTILAQAPTTSVTSGAVSSSVALGFGTSSKITVACSGAYGTSAPATVTVIYR